MRIDDVWANLQSTYEVFKDLVIGHPFHKIGSEITWYNYSPGIFKNLYAREYEHLVRNRQYSMLFKDNRGFIQCYYQFEGENVVKVKLAYYPYPIQLREDPDQVESFMDDCNDEFIRDYYVDLWSLLSHQFSSPIPDETVERLVKESIALGNFETEETIVFQQFEKKYKHTNTSHLRIDYDSKVKTHNLCEIQVGAVNNLRLPADRIVFPFTFVDFIVKNVFPQEYQIIASKANYIHDFNNSKNRSLSIVGFNEPNIFFSHR